MCVRACVRLRDFAPDICPAACFSFACLFVFIFFCCHCCAPFRFVSLQEQESKKFVWAITLNDLILYVEPRGTHVGLDMDLGERQTHLGWNSWAGLGSDWFIQEGPLG